MIGRTLAANCAACTLRAARMRLTGPAGSGVPNRFPRALAATRAALSTRQVATNFIIRVESSPSYPFLLYGPLDRLFARREA